MELNKIYRCGAGITNGNCKSYGLRSLTNALIEKIRSMGYYHELDESVRICDSCRLVVQHNRPPSKKRRSSGREPDNGDSNNQQPSTSHQVAEELPEVHSAASLESVSSLDQLQGLYKNKLSEQRVIASRRWDNSQATIHPFVVYYKKGETLENISLSLFLKF